jgi:FkbM family methyltransferase
LQENIKNNNCKNIELFNRAVSDKVGEVEFVRVLGNTTSSHISGDKTPYGELERTVVQTVDFKSVISWADFLKIDVEGHELVLIESTTKDDWADSDAMIEISNGDNAKKVFDFFNSIDVKMYSQKKGWERVTELFDMPTSYKEGSLFVSNSGAPFDAKN